MKVEAKNVAPCRAKLSVKAEAAEIHSDYEDVVRRYVREAPVRGFRTGKAPRAVVEREYHHELDRDIRQRLVSKFASQAIKDSKLSVVELVGVNNLLYSQETGLTFDLMCDVAPEFKLPKYQNIPVKLVEPAVEDSAVEEFILNMCKRFGSRSEGTAEQAVEVGDSVQINFTATSGGKPLSEVVAECGIFGEGEKFWMLVEEPGLIPEVAMAMVGMKIGEEKSVKNKFPKDFHQEQLQGIKAEYNVKLLKFSRQMPAEESLLFAAFKVEDGAGLRKYVSGMMLEEAKAVETNRRREEIADYLLKKCDFELPESEVGRETRVTIRMMLDDYARRGGKPEDLTTQRDEMLASATNLAKSRLRLNYILTRIAGEIEVTVDDAELDAEVKRMAVAQNTSEKELRAMIEKNYAMEQVRLDLRNRKAMDFLVDSLK